MVRPTIKSCRFQIKWTQNLNSWPLPRLKKYLHILTSCTIPWGFISFPYMPMNLCIVFGTIVVGLWHCGCIYPCNIPGIQVWGSGQWFLVWEFQWWYGSSSFMDLWVSGYLYPFFFAELEGLQLAFDFNSKEYDPTSFLGDFWFNLDPWLVIDEV